MPVIKNLNLISTALAALAFLPLTTWGAIEISPNRIVSGTATGNLIAIDVPNVTTHPTFGGPVWTTGSGINASAADQGFIAPSGPADGIREPDNNVGALSWEPDGTPLSEAQGYYTYEAHKTRALRVLDGILGLILESTSQTAR